MDIISGILILISIGWFVWWTISIQSNIARAKDILDAIAYRLDHIDNNLGEVTGPSGIDLRETNEKLSDIDNKLRDMVGDISGPYGIKSDLKEINDSIEGANDKLSDIAGNTDKN